MQHRSPRAAGSDKRGWGMRIFIAGMKTTWALLMRSSSATDWRHREWLLEVTGATVFRPRRIGSIVLCSLGLDWQTPGTGSGCRNDWLPRQSPPL